MKTLIASFVLSIAIPSFAYEVKGKDLLAIISPLVTQTRLALNGQYCPTEIGKPQARVCGTIGYLYANLTHDFFLLGTELTLNPQLTISHDLAHAPLALSFFEDDIEAPYVELCEQEDPDFIAASIREDALGEEGITEETIVYRQKLVKELCEAFTTFWDVIDGPTEE